MHKFLAYVIAALLAAAGWIVAHALFAMYPPRTMELPVYLYGGLFSMTILTTWWNLLWFKHIPMFIEWIRVPGVAIALGINSAYYDERLTKPFAQILVAIPNAKYLWIGIEVVLTLALIIGVHRWGNRLEAQQEPVLSQS